MTSPRAQSTQSLHALRQSPPDPTISSGLFSQSPAAARALHVLWRFTQRPATSSASNLRMAESSHHKQLGHRQNGHGSRTYYFIALWLFGIHACVRRFSNVGKKYVHSKHFIFRLQATHSPAHVWLVMDPLCCCPLGALHAGAYIPCTHLCGSCFKCRSSKRQRRKAGLPYVPGFLISQGLSLSCYFSVTGIMHVIALLSCCHVCYCAVFML